MAARYQAADSDDAGAHEGSDREQAGALPRGERPWWQFDGFVVRDSQVPKLFSCFYPVSGITLWPCIFLCEGFDSEHVINHERIHIAQANEMLIIGMYLLWLWEFVYGLAVHRDARAAYAQIRLEREAHTCERDLGYLRTRPLWAWRNF